MFLSGYVCKYLRDNAPLMTLMANKITHRKAPQPYETPYMVVLTAEDYDNGNLCVGSLTWKQEDFTIVVVGSDFASLQRPWKALEALLINCRNVHVTSTELGGTIHIQALLPQAPHVGEGIVVEGNEITDPCLVVPVKGSFTLPEFTS